MTNEQYDRQEVLSFKRELKFRNEGTSQEKIECVDKMLAEIAENPQKFRYHSFLLLHGDYGHGAKLMAAEFTNHPKLANYVKLFVLVAQTAYMTGESLVYHAWQHRFSLKAKEEMLEIIRKEVETYNKAWLAGESYEWTGENQE